MTVRPTGVFSGAALVPAALLAVGVPAALAAPAPRLSPVAMSHKVWRVGSGLARLSGTGTPVGTMFSFSLNGSAVVRLALKESRSGRTVATLTFPRGHRGLNRITFEGRVSSTRRLAPGGYSAHISARNSAGEARAPGLSFTIVRG